jgi:glutamyl-tRNA synthetase
MAGKKKNWKEKIRAYALENAIEYGEARVDKVLSRLFNEGLGRVEVKRVMHLIKKEVKKINKYDKKTKELQFGKIKNLVKKKRKKRGLKELENTEGKVRLRLAPFPSGALHIGNAKTYILNSLYAEKYDGELLLVIDDTIGSEEKSIVKDAYKLIPEAFEWLGIEYKKPVIYKSDRLKTYYKYAKKLIKKEEAYVCECGKEELRKNRRKGVECSCRQFPVKKQLERWKEMFKAEPGDFTLRIKTNMQDPNPAFRDRVLFRISDRKHPKVGKKYRVWPMLEFSWAIDDHLLGISHIIRGKDLMIESEMEKHIWEIFGWEEPEIIHTGMARIKGAKISKSKAQKEVKSGEYLGWEDPRTWSIQSLKKRGFQPEAIKKFVKKMGLSEKDVTIPIKKLYAINRKMIDRKADRYSFIENPRELKLKNKPKIKEVEVKIHPEKKTKRKIKVNGIFISEKDYKKYQGKEVRLMHLFNVKLGKGEFTSKENKDIPKINWVSKNIKAKIMMPNGKWLEGIVEEGVKKVRKGEVIQFERFGFVKLDKKNSEFWFAHR